MWEEIRQVVIARRREAFYIFANLMIDECREEMTNLTQVQKLGAKVKELQKSVEDDQEGFEVNIPMFQSQFLDDPDPIRTRERAIRWQEEENKEEVEVEWIY